VAYLVVAVVATAESLLLGLVVPGGLVLIRLRAAVVGKRHRERRHADHCRRPLLAPDGVLDLPCELVESAREFLALASGG